MSATASPEGELPREEGEFNESSQRWTLLPFAVPPRPVSCLDLLREDLGSGIVEGDLAVQDASGAAESIGVREVAGQLLALLDLNH